MKWYWKVRIYNINGQYAHAIVKTGRDLQEIGTIQDFYKTLTGQRMLLEGMYEEHPGPGNQELETAFAMLYGVRT